MLPTLIPAILGGHIINNAVRLMLTLPTCLGLGLKIFVERVENKYKDSTRITSNFQAQILGTNKNEGKTRGEMKAKRGKK